LPTLPGNDYLLDTGSSYSFSFTANPMRKLVQQQLHEDDQRQPGADAQHEQRVEGVPGVYGIPVSKDGVHAGYTNLNQFVSAAGMPEASYSNFYVGLQRWFKAF
jgi:hypothetical protein